jgi:hypothetical protein
MLNSNQKRFMTAWKKARPSRLDPFEETLFAMDAAKKTLTEMKQWLSAQGVTISAQGISQFLAYRRQRRWQAETLGQIANGLHPVAEAKAALADGPEPDLDTLVKLSRIMIFENAAKLLTEPQNARQTSQMTKMMLRIVDHQANREIRKDEIDFAERQLALRQDSLREAGKLPGPRGKERGAEPVPGAGPNPFQVC